MPNQLQEDVDSLISSDDEHDLDNIFVNQEDDDPTREE